MYTQDQLQEIIDQLAAAPTVAAARDVLWEWHKDIFYNKTPTEHNPAYLVYSANTGGDGGRVAADHLTRLGAEIAHSRCAISGGSTITPYTRRRDEGKVPPLTFREKLLNEAIYFTSFMIHFDDAHSPQWYRDRVAREGGRPEHQDVQAVGWPQSIQKIMAIQLKKTVTDLVNS